MSRRPDPNKGRLKGRLNPVDDDLYASDLALHDRFLNFSAEVLRLSLAGIAVIGFLMTFLDKTDSQSGLALAAPLFQGAVIFAIIFFALAASGSMAHRFYASDGMWYHLKSIRLLKLTGAADTQAVDVSHEERMRDANLGFSEKCLKASAVLLALGAAALGVAFVCILP